MKRVLDFKLILLIFFLSGVYITLFSESGFLERRKHREKINELENRVIGLNDENTRLSNLYRFYLGGGLTEEDLLKAGFVKRGEKVIFIRGNTPVNSVTGTLEIKQDKYISTASLRIGWMFICVVVLIIYFVSRSGKAGEQ